MALVAPARGGGGDDSALWASGGAAAHGRGVTVLHDEGREQGKSKNL